MEDRPALHPSAYSPLMETWPERERRGSERHSVTAKIAAQEISGSGILTEGSGAIYGQIRNVSKGGLCVFTDQACNLPAILRCEILFPNSSAAIPTLARVQWIQPNEEGGFVIGVQFLIV